MYTSSILLATLAAVASTVGAVPTNKHSSGHVRLSVVEADGKSHIFNVQTPGTLPINVLAKSVEIEATVGFADANAVNCIAISNGKVNLS